LRGCRDGFPPMAIFTVKCGKLTFLCTYFILLCRKGNERCCFSINVYFFLASELPPHDPMIPLPPPHFNPELIYSLLKNFCHRLLASREEPSPASPTLKTPVIGLIRNGIQSPDRDISKALAFATTHLAPLWPDNSKLLQDLEPTMALLCFQLKI